MNFKENEDFENTLTQLKNQVNEMSVNMLKQVDLTHSRESLKRELENQMKK
jgi:ABC-type Fe3+/spermidine/putrescine transport system ATPase subunit